MNNKQSELNRIVDICLQCCANEIDEDGHLSITKEQVLGKCRTDNAVMTRCILVAQVINAGYSISTTSQLIGRTTKSVHNLLELGYTYHKTSRAYRIAEAEATLKCKELGI